jgi:hypothetical protein
MSWGGDAVTVISRTIEKKDRRARREAELGERQRALPDKHTASFSPIRAHELRTNGHAPGDAAGVPPPLTRFLRQLGRRYLAIGHIVVDPTSLEPLALAMPSDHADRAGPLQFAEDEIALGIRVSVGSVRHLERELGK